MLAPFVHRKVAPRPTTLSYYVAPWGNDQWSGTEGAPWATFDHARQAIQPYVGTVPITVNARTGFYHQATPLTFTAADSGTPTNPVTYRAFPGETPVLSGALQITNWVQFSGAIWRAPFPPGVIARQLYVNGQRCVRAQSTAGFPHGYTIQSWGVATTDGYMQNFGNQSDIELVFLYFYLQMRVPVTLVGANGVVCRQPDWNIMLPLINRPGLTNLFAIENAFEFLTTAGQFYIDRAANFVYYIPRGGEDLTSMPVYAAVTKHVILCQGTAIAPVHDIAFEGLTLQHSGWAGSADPGAIIYETAPGYVATSLYPTGGRSYPGALHLDFTRNITFSGGAILNCAGNGVTFDHGNVGDTIIGNTINDVSESGTASILVVSDASDPRNFNSQNYVGHNTISGIGVEYCCASGVAVLAADHTTIEHNEIFNCSMTGIFETESPLYPPLMNSFNIIQNNNLHDCGQATRDGGTLYTAGRCPGGIVQQNLVTHQNTNAFAGTLYQDEGSQYRLVFNNIVHDSVAIELYANVVAGDETLFLNFCDRISSSQNSGSYPHGVPFLMKENRQVPVTQMPQTIINNAGPQFPWAPMRVPTAAISTPMQLAFTAPLFGNTGVFSWLPPVVAGTGLAGYELWAVQASIDESAPATTLCLTTTGPTITTYSYDDIAPNMHYTFYVIAFDTDGNTSYPSLSVSWDTDASVPVHGAYTVFS